MNMQNTSTPREKFEAFHAANPRVYEEFVRLGRLWKSRTAGRKIGIGALTERVRWELALATTDHDFKINNTYRAGCSWPAKPTSTACSISAAHSSTRWPMTPPEPPGTVHDLQDGLFYPHREELVTGSVIERRYSRRWPT